MENTKTQKSNILNNPKNSRKKYYIETYGCQMNVADSELVETILLKKGYQKSNSPENSDAIFMNTCAIREHAEEKVHSQLGRYNLIKKERPEVIIGVLGCMGQSLKHDLLDNRPYIDMILGPDSYRRLPELLDRKTNRRRSLVDTQLSRFEVYDDLFPSRKEGINAWISIMRGCDKFCTFCIVPFTRGRERSRSVSSIITETQHAIENGFSEITLLGQNVNSYNYDKFKFHQLLETISNVDGVKRIRYTSPHPQDITDELLYTMSEHDNICNYIHLPLQAGSNRILKRMNRTYTKEKFLSLAEKIKRILPNVGISTDIIVGFPGETDDDFKQTIEVMDEIKFDSAYNFKYSPRRGTKASEYDDQLNEEIKQYRLEQIIRLQKQHTLERNAGLVGTIQKVLVEKESKFSNDKWAGRTDSNKWVIFNKEELHTGDIIPIEIKEAKGITLHGKFLQNSGIA